MKENPVSRPIDPRVVIGHVHLKVADLERALGFYRGVLGFELQQRFGSQAAFISAGGYHHHIGLRKSEGVKPDINPKKVCQNVQLVVSAWPLPVSQGQSKAVGITLERKITTLCRHVSKSSHKAIPWASSRTA